MPQKQIDKELLTAAFQNMEKTAYSSNLQKATMDMMIQTLLPADEEKRLKEMFQQIDKDKSGTIDMDELLQGLTALYGEEKGLLEC